MKSIWKYLCSILVSGCLAVSAQTTPKLALAGVSLTPTLASKFASPTTAANPTSANVNVLGVWHAEVVNPVDPTKPPREWTVTIKQSTDGSLRAFFEHHNTGNSFFSTSIVSEGTHIKMTFYNDKARPANVNTVEGEVNPDFGVMQGVWSFHDAKRSIVSCKCTLRRTWPPSPAVAPPVSLADLTHSLDVQLFDRFKGEQFFSVMGDTDLKQAIPPTGQPPNPPYDLAKPDTAAQFKQAGINYLLVTSVEDYSDQTVEKRRTKDFHYQTGVYNGTSTYSRTGTHDARFGRNGYSGAGSASGASAASSAGKTTQGGLDPEVWQQQTIRLTVRCQLFDATTGELKKSTNDTFSCQRDYTAVAQGKNQLSTADLCEAAARKVSDWATILVDDAIFPIRVLAKDDQDITISRGSEAGLQVGQVFEVCIKGVAMKDPDTGKTLEPDVKTVGRVAIAKLGPKFSHAKVLDDKGIVIGATLVRFGY